MLIEAKNLALRIGCVIRSKKGQDLVILDLRPVAAFCDYFVITSTTSLRQANAVAHAIEEDLATLGIKPLSRVSPVDESGWIVLDFSGVIAHIFYKPMREFYSLERLWSDAKRVRATSKYEKHTRSTGSGNKGIAKRTKIR
ncbi:MAG: ribosome silencing factor [Candidatus Omnitrophota bacterium]